MATGHANIIEQIADPDVPLAQFRRLLKLEPSRSKPFTPAIGLDFGHASLAHTADPFTPIGGAVGDAFIQWWQEQYREESRQAIPAFASSIRNRISTFVLS
jgi:hypothetical protein